MQKETKEKRSDVTEGIAGKHKHGDHKNHALALNL